MRKNTARHWLHATLDLLPVILIPVFMIYSHRHTLTEQTNVDIQYKYESNEVNSNTDLVEGNIYELNINNTSIDAIYNTSYGYLNLQIINTYSYDFHDLQNSLDDYIFLQNDDLNTKGNEIFLNFSGLTATIDIYIVETDYIYEMYLEDLDNNFSFTGVVKYFDSDSIYDATEIFTYTDYNIIESVTVDDENVSITDAFMNNFNHTVNKYFNMGNVFNLKDVYHWFEVNIFNNQAPLVMESIYNIIVYEFIMDLLFLLYGLFMWFVDMCKRLMEKPLDSIK